MKFDFTVAALFLMMLCSPLCAQTTPDAPKTDVTKSPDAPKTDATKSSDAPKTDATKSSDTPKKPDATKSSDTSKKPDATKGSDASKKVDAPKKIELKQVRFIAFNCDPNQLYLTQSDLNPPAPVVPPPAKPAPAVTTPAKTTPTPGTPPAKTPAVTAPTKTTPPGTAATKTALAKTVPPPPVPQYQESQIQCMPGFRSGYYPYDPTKPIKLVRHDGKKLVLVTSIDLTNACKLPLILLVPAKDPKQFTFSIIPDDKEHFPGGAFNVFNFSTNPITLAIGTVNRTLQPNDSQVIMPEVLDQGLPLSVSVPTNNETVYSSNMMIRKQIRYIFFVTDEAGKPGSVLFFKTSDCVDYLNEK